MKIKKQDSTEQNFNPNKILKRIRDQSKGLKVNPDIVAQKVIAGVIDGMQTKDIDALIATSSVNMMLEDPDYSYLASRILITRHAKIIGVEPIDSDFLYDYKGFKSFLYKYSKRDDLGNPIELPHMASKRLSEFYWEDNPEEQKDCYESLRMRKHSLATPQIINAGTDRKGLLSCQTYFLEDDSKEGILDTLDQISVASSDGSGIGLHLHNLRSSKTLVSSFKGFAGGVPRMCDMVQSHMRFFRQGLRSGACAVYLGIWHKDAPEFLELRLHAGEQRERTPDLFTAICIPNLFYEKYIAGDESWYTFCPHEVKKAGFENLYNTHNEEFTELYHKLVEAGLGTETKTSDMMFKIQKSMSEAGLPYIFNWCNANKNHPQSNLGVCTGYQLCIEFSGIARPGEAAQCDLGLIPLMDLPLHGWEPIVVKATKRLVKDLNRAIDLTSWSNPAAEKGGLNQRAIGIGIAGLADYMAKHRIDFVGDKAKQFNRDLMKLIYTTAKQQSHELALEQGRTYGSYEGSQYHKDNYPMLNSILVCLMPSASTSLLLGCQESFEPFQANIYQRRLDAGEFTVLNKYMIRELQERGLWNEDTRNNILKNNGSVQNLHIDADFKQRYKTVWEHTQKELITLAGIRQEFVDQGQSMNIYLKEATTAKIGAILKYGWELGLPTGSYYTKVPSKLAAPTSLVQSTVEVEPTSWDIECFGCSS